MVQALTLEEIAEVKRRAARRTEAARDGAAVVGLAAIITGVGMLSVAWALIVGGAALLGLSIWGALRSDQSTARNSQRG
ncbi:MAG: hypothetical protein H6816_16050 [Phycisphaerales bacterium]|nr:hypothetical protein [Phycisphaerales bacterium]